MLLERLKKSKFATYCLRKQSSRNLKVLAEKLEQYNENCEIVAGTIVFYHIKCFKNQVVARSKAK